MIPDLNPGLHRADNLVDLASNQRNEVEWLFIGKQLRNTFNDYDGSLHSATISVEKFTYPTQKLFKNTVSHRFSQKPWNATLERASRISIQAFRESLG